MNKAEKAWMTIKSMDELASRQSPLHRLSSLSKLILTLVYIILIVSFDKYDFMRLFVMMVFPVIGYTVSGISLRLCFYRLRFVLPLVLAVGIFNPIFDRQPLMAVGSLVISGGTVSMITLMMKGVFSLMMTFLLAATTTIEALCQALRRLHVPRMITALFLLTFRYISVLLRETAVMTEAYSLRAPGQRGLHVSAWGSFLGQLLLRSMDRAGELYDSMTLRGFDGSFYDVAVRRSEKWSLMVTFIGLALMVTTRFADVAAGLGGLFV